MCQVLAQSPGACTYIYACEETHPPPMLFCHLNVASSQNFLFFYFLFFLNLYCSTHGDAALVGRVTVNAIFLGILIVVSPFLFIFALSNITILRCCCEAPSQRARATRLLLAFLFFSFANRVVMNI